MKKPETPLERHVARWLKEEGKEYYDKTDGIYRDLMHGGCSTGIVTHLVLTSDCIKFYRRHKSEINRLLYDVMESCGIYDINKLFNRWDEKDPLAIDDYNQNQLAWFGFEETARRLMEDE